MAYLSRIWINPLRQRAQKLIENPHALHASVLGGLSRQPVEERVLWRLELETAHRAGLLVLTQSMPSWEHLVEQAGWPSSEDPQSKVRSYDPLLDKVIEGQEFGFRLRANPTISTRNPTKPSQSQSERLARSDRPRGVRVGHRTASQQRGWFLARIRDWGFEMLVNSMGDPDLAIVDRQRIAFTKTSHQTTSRGRVTLQVATFEGRLRVIDAAAARHSLLDGVGTGRAYGCGLVTLAIPQSQSG